MKALRTALAASLASMPTSALRRKAHARQPNKALFPPVFRHPHTQLLYF